MTARALIWIFMIGMLVLSWVGAWIIYRAAEMGDMVGPLSPRSFERMTIVAVGTGGPYENPTRGGPATGIALESRVVLVDAGRGVAEGLRFAGIPVSQPDTVLLTNLLPENTVGLDDLIHTGWLDGRTEALRVIGPTGTAARVEALTAAYRDAGGARIAALGLPASGGVVDVLEVGEGWSEKQGELTLTAGALPGGPSPTLAWRAETFGSTVVVSGAGWAPDALVAFAKNADVLVHEAVYVPSPEDIEAAEVQMDPERLRRESELHTSILDVGGLAERAGVGTLALVRMRPPPIYAIQVSSVVNDTFGGAIWIPEDGDELEP